MCAGQIDVDQICKMTSLKQFTISQLPLYTAKDWATRALQNIANLMELKIFETSVVVIDNLIDIVQNWRNSSLMLDVIQMDITLRLMRSRHV
jgi:hypothetical protein